MLLHMDSKFCYRMLAVGPMFSGVQSLFTLTLNFTSSVLIVSPTSNDLASI